MFCLFITFTRGDADTRLDPAAALRLEKSLRAIDALAETRILTPAVARDRYYDDGPPPVLALQLYFDRLETLERAAGPDGPLVEIISSLSDDLGGATGTHQAMWSRPFPVAAGGTSIPQAEDTLRCAFMVHYHGEPADANEWHSFYIQHHPPIMATFPEIREIELYTRIDWIDALPTQRVDYFQRNKVVFDSPAALEAALSSPTRELMKADREKFPHFTGGSIHVPMHSKALGGLRSCAGNSGEAQQS